jgi:hypothetical protein
VIRHLATAAALGTALGFAPRAQAQSSRPGAAAIAAAHHAVDATDAHTAAMSAPTYVAPATPVRIAAVTQSRTPTPPRAPAASKAATAAPAAGADSTAASARPKAGKNVMSFSRETYSYTGGGRRDPFKSLLAAGGDLRPMIGDLRLVTIVYAANGQNSVAILRDLTTKEQYRVRVGQTLGRMKVAAIDPRQVTFTIEEFGYSRQETLMYNDPSTMRPK